MNWDVSSFGNEQAQAWLKSLTESLSGDVIEEAIAKVEKSDIFIDGQDAERGIAAAEVVAASHGKPSDSVPVDVGMWLKAQKYKAPERLIYRASKVVEKIFKNSELRDLWDGTDAAVEWQRTMQDLRDRLKVAEAQPEKVDQKPALQGQTTSDTSPESVFNEAVELVATGNQRGAIAKFNHVIDLDEDYVLGYIGRGTSFLALGKYSEAVSDFNAAIDRDPEISDAYYLRAQGYFQKSNYGRAIADLTILINMSPDKLDAYIMRGLANFALGRDKKALADYSKVIEKDSSLASAYLHRAKVYEREGNFDLAGKDRREYEKLAKVESEVK